MWPFNSKPKINNPTISGTIRNVPVVNTNPANPQLGATIPQLGGGGGVGVSGPIISGINPNAVSPYPGQVITVPTYTGQTLTFAPGTFANITGGVNNYNFNPEWMINSIIDQLNVDANFEINDAFLGKFLEILIFFKEKGCKKYGDLSEEDQVTFKLRFS